MSRLKKVSILGVVVTTAAGALAVTSVGGHEGLRLKTYKDIVGVPTYCYGETKGAKMGQVYSKEQCDKILLNRLDEFGNAVERCVTKTMSDRTMVAFTSLAYNVGEAGFCRSSVVRLYNAGDREGACKAMLAFDKARVRGKLKPIKGLTDRRKRESEMCLAGLRWL